MTLNDSQSLMKSTTKPADTSPPRKWIGSGEDTPFDGELNPLIPEEEDALALN